MTPTIRQQVELTCYSTGQQSIGYWPVSIVEEIRRFKERMQPEIDYMARRVNEIICRRLDQREAIMREFLISGAMPGELSMIETKRPMLKFDIRRPSETVDLEISDWRVA